MQSRGLRSVCSVSHTCVFVVRRVVLIFIRVCQIWSQFMSKRKSIYFKFGGNITTVLLPFHLLEVLRRVSGTETLSRWIPKALCEVDEGADGWVSWTSNVPVIYSSTTVLFCYSFKGKRKGILFRQYFSYDTSYSKTFSPQPWRSMTPPFNTSYFLWSVHSCIIQWNVQRSGIISLWIRGNTGAEERPTVFNPPRPSPDDSAVMKSLWMISDLNLVDYVES